MEKAIIIQGRETTETDIQFVRELIASNPSWNRTRLSNELCNLWNWRDIGGRPKDMACRSFLLKLEQRGLINLPARQRSSGFGSRKLSIPDVAHICTDWIQKYQPPVLLLETFVDCERFRGTCYQAANWIYVGKTQGRSRNDRYVTLCVPVKDCYLYPLVRSFREVLQ